MNKIRLMVALFAATLVLPIALQPAVVAAAPSTAPGATASLEQQVKDAQAKLEALNNQVERANGQLDSLNRKLAEDQKLEGELNKQLSDLARLQYQQPVMTVTTVLGAQSLDQLLGDIAQTRLVARKQKDLLAQASKLREQDQKARDDVDRQLASIKAARDQASQILAKAQELRSAELEKQAQAMVAPPPLPTNGVVGNHFIYGYCTWWVANKRPIPWFGNAIEWWPNALQYGFVEGQTPKVGAIMVTSESPVGHVAYVTSVNGDNSWTVSEMNYQGWNVSSNRTLRPGFGYLIGFIY